MKTINGQNFWEKKDILEKYPISERTFFTRIKKYKSQFPQTLMNNKNSFWIIHETIINDIFKVIKRPKKNEIIRWKKWIKTIQWNIFGNVRPIETNVVGNLIMMEFLFKILNNKFGNDREIGLFYCIEDNKSGNNQHSHFLIKLELNQREFELLKDEVFNTFPNHFFEKYKTSFSMDGISYSSKTLGNDSNRFGFLSNKIFSK